MRPQLPLLLFLALASCGERSVPVTDGGTAPAGDLVLTTFYPTQYFAERIAGEHLDIRCPLPDDADPIFWQPDRATLELYQSADLIITNGAELEKWTATSSLPENRVVDTARSFEQDFIRFETSTKHRHGPEGEHTHEGIDGHTWLDPINAKVQAAAIRQAFAKRWPEYADEFEANFALLIADLDDLDEAFKELDVDQPLFASHPAYNYLARRYGWAITNLNLDPDTLPGKDAVPADHAAKLILWESSPREKSVELLAKRDGVASIVFSPAEHKGEEDYLATMHANLERLKAALQ